MKKFRFTTIILIVLIALGAIWGLSPHYLKKAVINGKPDLDDYQVFDNRIVATAHPQPWMALPGSDRREVPESYRKSFEDWETVAFLVVRDQQIRFEKYWDGFNPDSRANSFSMAKSILSLLVGIALDEGTLGSVDQPVGDFLPEYQEGEKARVTIRHLLEMSSGLSWDEAYSSLFSITTKGYYGNDLPALVLTQEAVREPGTLFEYKSGNTQLLALIIEKATNRKVSTYASEKLWIPMGASHDAWWSLDKPNGSEKAFCCFNANARDFARLGQLILFNGNWYGKQLVPAAYLKQALTPASHLRDHDGKPVSRYGWHWWIENYKERPVYYMMGLKGQYVIIIPDLQTVIVRLGHQASSEKIDGTPADLFTWIDAGIELSEVEVK